LAEPSDDTLFNILALPKAGLAPGLKQGLKARLERYPRVDWPRPEPSDGTTPRTTTAVKDVEKGRLGSAARRLAGTAAVATLDNEVVATLRDKHPPGPEDTFGPTDGPSSGDIPSEEEIMAAFKTFKPDTSPGLSGWTHHLLATALRVPAFLKAIHTLTDAAVISLPIKMGGLGILSYKTVAPHAYAAASEGADTTLAPILTPGTLPASTQL
ncbi:hypothetical protein JCM24511_10212, partial [Saitozyma sp. JCM 24511]